MRKARLLIASSTILLIAGCARSSGESPDDYATAASADTAAAEDAGAAASGAADAASGAADAAADAMYDHSDAKADAMEGPDEARSPSPSSGPED